MSKDSATGVMNIKKKVATLKQELDEANDRANEAEAKLREKDVLVDKVRGVVVSGSAQIQVSSAG